MKYGFIGCGNMGGAIARALSKSTKQILVSDRSGKAAELARELGIDYGDNVTIAQTCDVIFLGVKPHMMQGVLASLQTILAERKPLLITMAAGLEIRQIEEFAGTRLPIIRIMPNAPTAIGGLNIIASGGISFEHELEELDTMGVWGAILGKALYTGKRDLERAVRLLQKEEIR